MQVELGKVRDIYAADSRSQSFNALVYGDFGTGKTFSLRTARQPVYIYSFDQGGTKSLKSEIEKGGVIPDTRFEHDQPDKPFAYKDWEREFDRLRKTDFFDNIGTLVLDSLTSWADSIMSEILRRDGRAGSTPHLRDYQVQMLTIRDVIQLMNGLPCDFIAIGHMHTEKDEQTGKVETGPMVTGKLSKKLPSYFDEVYVALSRGKGDNVTYQFLTVNDGYYKARSRLASNGKIPARVDQDFKKILKLADYSTDDKPSLKENKDETGNSGRRDNRS